MKVISKCIGVKFAAEEHLVALKTHGICAFRVTSEERHKADYPKVGDIIHLLLDDSDRESCNKWRVPVRLASEQIAEDGSSICMFTPAVVTYRRDV